MTNSLMDMWRVTMSLLELFIAAQNEKLNLFWFIHRQDWVSDGLPGKHRYVL